jgi:hypothetical protein
MRDQSGSARDRREFPACSQMLGDDSATPPEEERIIGRDQHLEQLSG